MRMRAVRAMPSPVRVQFINLYVYHLIHVGPFKSLASNVKVFQIGSGRIAFLCALFLDRPRSNPTGSAHLLQKGHIWFGGQIMGKCSDKCITGSLQEYLRKKVIAMKKSLVVHQP